MNNLGNSSHHLGHAILYKKLQYMEAKTAWKAQKVTKIKKGNVCEFWKDKITWSLLNIKLQFLWASFSLFADVSDPTLPQILSVVKLFYHIIM